MLEALEVKRSYWDKYKKITRMDIQEQMHINNIRLIFKLHRFQFGYRKITEKLNTWYEKIGLQSLNHKKIARLMKENFIISVQQKNVKKKRSNKIKTIQSTNNYDDLIKRKFNEIRTPLSVLYTDITYLNLNGRTYYQSTIIDEATRQIIDYKISNRMTNKLVLDNLNTALKKIKKIKKDLNGIIIHSDHGSQYTSPAWFQRCCKDNLIISMGAKKTCADNQIIESFHSLLKKGTIHSNKYNNIEEYILDVIKWNEWYIRNKNILMDLFEEQNTKLTFLIEFKNKKLAYANLI